MNTFFYYLSMFGVLIHGVATLSILSGDVTISLYSIPMLIFFGIIHYYTSQNRKKVLNIDKVYITGTQKIKKQSKDLASKTVMIDGVEYILTPTKDNQEQDEDEEEEDEEEEIKPKILTEEEEEKEMNQAVNDFFKWMGIIFFILIYMIVLAITISEYV
ncbi:hypothetical protein LAT59_00050 [Candidatus Gracilibacteria bacterium]|nr:hypothetical protein [Candidatus Gracilibacteria bacterium]